MSTIVPELKLYQIVNALIDQIEVDFNSNVDKENTFLFHLFGDPSDLTDDHTNKLGKYNYYDQAKSLFVGRDKDHPRKVTIRMMFDAAQANVPTIHLTMPMEEDQYNTIGVGESGSEHNIVYNKGENTSTPLYMRRFQTKYHMVCTSESSQEVFIIYHVLRAAFIAALDYVDLAGLRNPQLSGQDVKISEDKAPPHIFARGLGLSCFYEVKIPRYYDAKIIADIITNGTIISGSN